MADNRIQDGVSLVPSGPESSDGTFRVYQTDTTGAPLLILQKPGIFFGELAADVSWQAISNTGNVAGTKDREVPASEEIPAHVESDVVIQVGEDTNTISIPVEWFPASTAPSIHALSDDGMVLIHRSIINPDESTYDEAYLLNASSNTYTLVRRPGLGVEAVVSLSSNNSRLLGIGPKPFQIAPNGTPIRIADLQIKSDPSATAVSLSTLYPNAITPNHITSDGRITITTTDASNATTIIQLVPYNDANQNGMADDWETSEIAYLIASDPQSWGYLELNTLDPDTSYWNSSLTAAQAYASGSSPGESLVPKLMDMPRYALFPITNAQQPGWPSDAFQISNQGTVLYANGTWKAGVWTPLVTTNTGVTSGSARAINDNDVILGLCETQAKSGDSRSNAAGVCAWYSPDAPPFIVSTGGSAPVFACPSASCNVGYGMGYVSLFPGPVLSNEGGFFVKNMSWDATTNTTKILGFSKWQLPAAAGDPATQSSDISQNTMQGLTFNQGSYMWASTTGPGNIFGNAGAVYQISGTSITSLTPLLPFMPINVGSLPPNSAEGNTEAIPIAMSKYPWIPCMSRYKGVWHECGLYSKAIDMSTDGTAIGHNLDSLIAPTLLAGKWIGIERSAPYLPAEWKDSTVKLVDTTPGGWILTKRGETYPSSYAVMLPVKVDGVNNNVTPSNMESAGGVDRLSMTADKGTGHVPEMWIMAPIGGTNTVRFRSPLNSISKLELSCEKANFVPAEVTNPDIEISVSGNAVNSADVRTTLKLGGSAESISAPLKIKVMKRRTVKVALHKVKGKVKDHPETVTTPPHMPTKAGLENYLNAVFGKQVNVFFDCTEPILEAGADGNGILFDLNGNGTLALGSQEETEATPNAQSTASPPTANIDVWVVGGGIQLTSIDPDSPMGTLLAGDGFRFGRKIIVSDLCGHDDMSDEQKAKFILFVITHEVGHVLTNEDHPQSRKSSARLEKYTNTSDPYVTSRLMCAGSDVKNPNDPGIRLIKAEWDLIETWLEQNLDKKN